MADRLTLAEVNKAWEVLSGIQAVPHGELVTREAPWAYRGRPMLLAEDSEARRHLLIRIDQNAKFSADRGSAGVQMVERQLLDGGTLARFVDLVCRKAHLNEHFSVIVSEVVATLRDQGRADQAIRGVLEQWRELLGGERVGAPSQETLVGVYAELQVLLELAEFDPAICRGWVGPDGARHDIQTPEASIEVKGTRSRTGRRLEIHGVEQLEEPSSGELYLAYVKVESDPSGWSVLDQVEQLVSLGCSEETLRAGLLKNGVVSDHEDLVRGVRLTTKERRTYRVTEAFPRITGTSFAAGAPPPGVVSIDYEIDISGDHPEPLNDEEWVMVGRRLAGSMT